MLHLTTLFPAQIGKGLRSGKSILQVVPKPSNSRQLHTTVRAHKGCCAQEALILFNVTVLGPSFIEVVRLPVTHPCKELALPSQIRATGASGPSEIPRRIGWLFLTRVLQTAVVVRKLLLKLLSSQTAGIKLKETSVTSPPLGIFRMALVVRLDQSPPPSSNQFQPPNPNLQHPSPLNCQPAQRKPITVGCSIKKTAHTAKSHA